MNGEKIALLLVSVVAVGVFALPSTISLFAGQHTWYNLSGKENNVPCEKCHADVANEMKALVGPHTGEMYNRERFKCEYCHRLFPIEHKNSSFSTYTYAFANGTAEIQPGKEAHAASTVPCMYCHSGSEWGVVSVDGKSHTVTDYKNCVYCHGKGKFWEAHEGNFKNEDCYRCHVNNNYVYYVPPAGGFNLTINTTDTGELAAHKTFVMNSISNPDMEDANEACIACHTKIPVKINWTHRYSLEFNATPEFELPPTHFNVTDWSFNGTYNIIVYGWRNGTGNTSKEGWPGGYP